MNILYYLLMAVLGPVTIYPNHTLTPGVILPHVTKEHVCTPGYSKTVRNVTDSEKKAVMARYRFDPAKCRNGGCEIDHFISLELGGSNDIANLWPEPADTLPVGFHEKDRVEDHLHTQVCHGAMTLRQAQDAIRTDWYKVYLDMTAKKK